MNNKIKDDDDINMRDKILKKEKLFIYKQVCQCYNQCLKFNDNEFHINHQSNICNKIIVSNSNPDHFVNLVNKSLDFLIKNNYIKLIGRNNYYITLNDTVRFTWDNIKHINDKDIKVKELFWLFRKLVVDSLLQFCVNYYNKKNTFISSDDVNIIIKPDEFNKTRIYSVGSSSITSDYDITLYNNNNYVLTLIIEKFEKIFIKLFGNHSSIIFDTNIYGKSYIIFDNNSPDYTKINNCSNQKEIFYYLNSLNLSSGLITSDKPLGNYKYTQVIWALIKFMNNLHDSLGESIYNQYISFLKRKINHKIIDIAQETLIYLLNLDTSYTCLIKKEEYNKKVYTSFNFNSLLFLNDYISFINFFGQETYFTRGAFLFTVVNNQMCNSDSPLIDLFEEDYIASILENSGFFFLHNDKIKYLTRIKNSFISLNQNYTKYNSLINSIYFNNIINVTFNDYKYCDWIDNNDFDLLKCEKYDIFQSILKLIYRLLKIYINKCDFTDFPFYTIYKHLKTLI